MLARVNSAPPQQSPETTLTSFIIASSVSRATGAMDKTL